MIISFEGNTPHVAANAWVADNATLVGSVDVEGGASIWFGAVLRADEAPIRLGADSNVQDNCVLHADPGIPTTVGRRVRIGHAAVVHGSTIEDDALIGMGAILMNRVVVGAGSLVAAGALITGGTGVPPGSLVAGVPAKVLRPLRDTDEQAVRRNAADYVRRAQRFRAALTDALRATG